MNDQVAVGLLIALGTPLAYFVGKGIVTLLKWTGRRIGTGIVEEVAERITGDVRHQLKRHTDDEGTIVRLVVQEELGNALRPVIARLDVLEGAITNETT